MKKLSTNSKTNTSSKMMNDRNKVKEQIEDEVISYKKGALQEKGAQTR